MAAHEARRDLIRKIELEKKLKSQISKINNKIVKNVISTLNQTGNSYNASLLESELRDTLNEHYEKTADVFSDQIAQSLPADIAATTAEAAAINQALTGYFAARAVEQSAIITKTNQKDVDNAVQGARDTRDEDDKPLSRREQAREAGARTSRKLKGREQSIAITETQTAAETSKATEAEVLIGRQPSVLAGSPLVAGVSKEWVTAGDERVRNSHASADSQVKDLSKPFIVGGQMLRWPSDTSLGASAGNVINCRCASVYDKNEIYAERRRKGQITTFETEPNEQLIESIGQ